MSKPDCLRGFPHVLKRIEELWGSPECDLYITQLLIPDRDRKEGFPPDAFKELTNILDVHRLLYAACNKPDCCIENKVIANRSYRW